MCLKYDNNMNYGLICIRTTYSSSRCYVVRAQFDIDFNRVFQPENTENKTC
jgi:hypothetical protein